MAEEYIRFNTDTNDHNIIRSNPVLSNAAKDPWSHLPVDEWIQKQIDWCEQPDHISGRGLIDVINNLPEKQLIGVEIGVCLGVTTELFAQKITNLQKLYGVDSYAVFTDWNGVTMGEDKQSRFRAHATKRLGKYDKIEQVFISSTHFALTRATESLDFCFIDGDHSHEGALRDFESYYPLIKKGGLFAGHDLNLPTVATALQEFLGNKFDKIGRATNDAWYLMKE
mgnify:CR=1 FL=1